MEWYVVLALLAGSFLVLHWLSAGLVSSLIQIGKFLRWREFIIAFFIMAFATSLPNLFVDFNAVIQRKPEIAFGDIVGGNLVDLTLSLALATFFSRKGIEAESKMVQTSALFTSIIAILPIILILDRNLNRGDGIILMLVFLLYSWWLFSKHERFKKIYKTKESHPMDFKGFLKSLAKIIIIVILLLIASQIIIKSAEFFSLTLGVSLSLIGILLIGLGNSFPEIYFAIVSARQDKNWLVLGDLMGSVIVCTTLVLGLIAFILPFQIPDITPFLTARLFLIVASLLSLIFIVSGRKITKKEGVILLFLYIFFLLFEVFMPFIS